MTISILSRLVATALLAVALGAPAFAYDTSDEGGGSGGSASGGTTSETHATPAVPTLADARADIGAKDWSKAITDLKGFLKANGRSADGWNLLGFSYRNHGDLKLADSAYDRALKLDPNHTGALSYQGILYVKLGELDEAKANLAKIKQICGNTSCAEYVALSKVLG